MDARDAPPANGGAGGDDRPEALLIAVDGRGAVTAWSPGAQHLLGYRSQQVVGRPVAEILAPGTPMPAWDRMSRWAGFDGDLAMRHRDGGLVRVAAQLHPLTGDDRTVLWLLTSRPAAGAPGPADEAPLLDWLFSSAPVALTLYDAEVRCLRQNAAMVRITGVTDEERRSLPLKDVLWGPDSERWEQALRQVAHKHGVRARVRFDHGQVVRAAHGRRAIAALRGVGAVAAV